MNRLTNCSIKIVKNCVKPFPNRPFWDHPKLKEAADDNLNLAVNPFPNGNIFDLSKFKAFVDDKMDVSKRLIFVLGRVENIMGNEENAGYFTGIFSLSPTMIFESLFYHSRKNQELFGNGLKDFKVQIA